MTNSSNENKPMCKRCLLAEIGEADVLKSIQEIIAAMPDEKRADDETYKKRLSLCTECNELNNGMCRQCGCYVELRAVKINMYCPDIKPKW